MKEFFQLELTKLFGGPRSDFLKRCKVREEMREVGGEAPSTLTHPAFLPRPRALLLFTQP